MLHPVLPASLKTRIHPVSVPFGATSTQVPSPSSWFISPRSYDSTANTLNFYIPPLLNLRNNNTFTKLGEKETSADTNTPSPILFDKTPQSLQTVMGAIQNRLKGITQKSSPTAAYNNQGSPTLASVLATLAGSLYSTNLLWESHMAPLLKAEQDVSQACASLVGFDRPQDARGIFTFGGVGTVLYGVKMGLAKALPNSNETGLIISDSQKQPVILASKNAHYAKNIAAMWLGIGTNNVYTIDTLSDGAIDPQNLKTVLTQLKKEGIPVAAILATVGTTDTFGVDDVSAIKQVRDEVYGDTAIKPHLHADAVFGWPWIVFNTTTKKNNPLNIPEVERSQLKTLANRLSHLKDADSIGFDFHKAGFTPIASSLFLVKNHQDMELLRRPGTTMPYVNGTPTDQQDRFSPMYYTLEGSRSASGVLAAEANLRLLGRQGFQQVLSKLYHQTVLLRDAIKKRPNMLVLNDKNPGNLTLIRVYPPNTTASEAYDQDLQSKETLTASNEFLKKVYAEMMRRFQAGESQVVVNWTRNIGQAVGDTPVSALKVAIMSPFTEEGDVKAIVNEIQEAIEKVSQSS